MYNSDAQIEDLINSFVSRFDCDAEFSDEFFYRFADATVGYTLTVDSDSDILWAQYVKDTFKYTITDLVVFSLLHELGHHCTKDKFTPKEYCAERQKVETIEKSLKYSTTAESDKRFYLKYFDLPMEKAATKWAVTYARKNKTQLFYFSKKLHYLMRG